MTRLNTARVSAGRNDHHTELYRALEDAALARGGIPVDTDTLHAGFREFEHQISIRTIAEEWLSSHGLPPTEHPINEALVRSLEVRRSSRGLGGDDFPALIENINHKALLLGWEGAPALYKTIARSSKLNDFKQASRSGLAATPLLEKPGEHGEIKSMLLSSVRAYIRADSYAGSYTISREALVNDDLDALTRPLYEAAFVAAATVDAALIALLVSNSGTGPVMTDGVALFDSAHANYDATAGAPSVSTLEVGRQRMRVQKAGVRYLNIAAKYLLVPPAYETTAKVLAASEAIPGQAGALEVVVAPQLLDGVNGDVAWYLLADQVYDTLDVGFVSSEPELIATEKWSVDGTSSKIALAFGVAALSHLGIYRRKGA